MKRERTFSATALLLGAALLFGGGNRCSAAADSFYVDLLHEGTQSYDRADYAGAARSLRLACFGLLDDLRLLGECLPRLALAQDKVGDHEGLHDTWKRLAEAEERYGVYSQASLPNDVRTALEQRLAAQIPAASLDAVPAFRGAASRQFEAQLAAMQPRQRRQALEARIAAEPKNPQWLVLAGELDLAEHRAPQALSRAQAALVLAPDNPRAVCLRGAARAAPAAAADSAACREAVVDLDACAQSRRDAEHAAALLGCWVTLGDWRHAEDLLRTLPPAVTADRGVATLAKRIDSHAAAPSSGTAGTTAAAGAPAAPGKATPPASGRPASSAATTAPTPTAGPRTPPPAAAGATGAASPSGPLAPLTTAERDKLETARRLLEHETSAHELRRAFDLASGVADAHHDSADAQRLAGEAAYRISRWQDATGYLRRGNLSDDQPELLFYMAVSLYEVGSQPAAATALHRALPNLRRTAYVDSYVKKIDGGGAP